MKYFLVITVCVSMLGCGTRPPLPPECEGALSPINVPTITDSTAGTIHESRSSP